MPFVQRVIEPKYLSRVTLFNEDGTLRVADDELEAVTNSTLCNALRQLASIALVADDIFKELGGQLRDVYKRSEDAKSRIALVEEKIARFDPKKVPVPVGDICSFAQTKEHYAAKHPLDINLFGVETRPNALKSLYEAANKTPVHAMRQLDRWRRDGHRSSRFFVCTPILGAKRRRIRGKVDIDIETRMPAVVEDLRRWTSDEAVGDITVGLNCATRITSALSDDERDGTIGSDDEGIDHKLPSPEEQLQVVALRFPAELVAVDVSGRSFDRMSLQRRSLMTGEVPNRTVDIDTIRRRGRTRRPRNRRRNTLAGTDQKEIQNALTAGDDPQLADTADLTETRTSKPATVPRSKSSDLLRSASKKDYPEMKISRFNSLKQWGKSQYEKFRNKSGDKNEISSGSNKSKMSEDGLDDFNLYETVTMKRRRDLDKDRKSHERNSSVSSSEKSLQVTSGALSSMMSIAVKLRDSSLQRRQRRQGNKDEPHSSSGNWSASSESGRASIGSEITASTVHPRSTTSAATSSNSLNHPPSSVNSRRRFNFDTSSSVTSEGSTLTPDIIHDLHEDGDSVYSCDTEGYYTSFHMDSGLKTLKEEDLPSTPLQSTSAFSNSGSNNTVLSAENEYELFGKGSTSTTTSSAGTVCTTLRAAESNRSLIIGPAVPERKSSLSKLSTNKPKSSESSLERDNSEKTGTVKRSPAPSNKPTVVAVIHKASNNGGDVSPDSGHNTSSSPIESVSSPNGLRSGSDFEFSESSDMEGPERIERIRVKTTINSSRIPSMCAITPSQSDDESSSNSSYKKHIEVNNLKNAFPSENNERFISTSVKVNINNQTGYVTVEHVDERDGEHTMKPIRAPSPSGGSVIVKADNVNENPSNNKPVIKSSLLPLNNMLGRLKTSFASRRERSKSPKPPEEPLDMLGEYVTLADVRNNNEKYTPDDLVNMNLKNILSGKIKDTEYVSLNELPVVDNNNIVSSTSTSADSSLERKRRQGARVMLDAEGKVVYSSDSLRRRKPPTSFEPGPFVKPIAQQSPQMSRTTKPIRPVTNTQSQMKLLIPQTEFNRPMSPTSGNKVIIKASGNQPEIVRTPSAVVQPACPKMRPLSPKGAYVHVQAPGGPLSPKDFREGVLPPSSPKDATLTMFGYADNEPYYYHPQSYYQQPDYRQGGTPFYSTLPSKKTQYFPYDPPPERSVTPDITRGLSKMSDESLIHRIGIPVNARQYGSPEHSTQEESFKVSPIDPRNVGSFKSSTPSQIRAAENLESRLLSPKRSTRSNDELYAVIHKTKKKLNIEDNVNRASPPVMEVETSTPKKMSVETGYIGSRANASPSRGEYIDFTANIDKLSPINEPKTCNDRKGMKKTSTLDFKRLLLQKSSSLSGNKKLSAVEQLKLSKEQMEKQKESHPHPSKDMTILDLSASPRSLVNRKIYNPPGSPERGTVKPANKILSPRSQWRFANPRSNVLSSTILEDCREDDNSSNASKSSLEKRSLKSQSGEVKPIVENKDTRIASVSERISVQRARFFGNEEGSTAKKSPPTLETAF
ncbi:actin remodeling regulator NHS [Euwallacea fornicatus]|uniref:actin remodeling regulator NHS n=1 Tax=Euwallacea fornicatus TaxID=995702 RepID=UPI00338D8A63